MSKFRQNLTFVRQLWANKRVIRDLLNSQEYIFVRDFLPGHFYSPIPNLRDALNSITTDQTGAVMAMPAINVNEAKQTRLMELFSQFYPELPFPDKPTEGARYYLDNPFFSYGDGIILYCLMRQFQPRRIVEVGSGFSSAAMLDVNDWFFGRKLQFTFIEPSPERLNSLLSDRDKNSCTIVANNVQHLERDVFQSLDENDFLFVDSSHVGKTGSDVLHLLFRILPSLQKGVIVHFHDIVWPFEYPKSWLQEGRAWNETYFLRAFLEYNSAFEVLFFNSFMAMQCRDILTSKIPRVLSPSSFDETIPNSSLWLRKVI
jgi:predicted O-methyltransferase YrrM